ncbi:glycoside hydrolase family 3 C-terminal domain-containing protein [Marinomonas spartinae]|uniref:glycoside hydrolase family 3 C-terminal domain-containing protein n=1 Tax=Marinomonas spartinae TaxID=1792290 RepID=UPI0018F134A7|nr:glycoside hydrolase family 3 C-terminal domain-containing protein [Marinomonas spartinae]MBJ7555901.1 glycoside hydrolase family 3 C-terminal domain-containing protein [Marinomonas spartinae]
MSATSINTLLDAMTLEEQVSLLSGQDFWSIASIQRLDIGELRVTDGPNGARGSGSLIGGNKSACFPCGIALGATWNPELLYRIGSAIADEVKSKGAHVSLAPTVNLQRTATNGRNFECYSEDAVLTASLAVQFIKGLQDKQIGATVKHFVGNESEIQRTTISSEIDERTLREHYLYPFEQAVKQADTWAIMSSYNKLNGVYTSENEWLLSKVLRDEWGFEGIVMSDWFGSQSTSPTINAGLNLEMPGPSRDRGNKLIAAVNEGAVDPERVRYLAHGMLTLLERVGVLQTHTEREEQSVDCPEHRELIRVAGAEATVLLKNDNLLPLDHPSSIAVLGPNADTAQIMGGGSAQLNPHYAITPLAGLITQLGEETIVYAQGCSNRRYEPLITGTFQAHYFTNRELSGDPVYTETVDQLHAFLMEGFGGGKVEKNHFSILLEGDIRVSETANYHLGAFSAGYIRVYLDEQLIIDSWGDKWQRGTTFFEEGSEERVESVALSQDHTYRLRVEFACLPNNKLGVSGYRVGLGLPTSDRDIAEAVALAKNADTAIVFVGRNAEWDTEGGDLPHIRLPGRQDELIDAVAAVNSKTIVVLQTGGPVEMPWLNKVSAVLQAWYPGQEAGNAIADVLLGKQEPSGRLAQTFPVIYEDTPIAVGDTQVYPGREGKIVYQEGEFFGYRHYDEHDIEPLFAFGFGLGYTQFSLQDAQAEQSHDGYEVTVTLSNVGKRTGQTVVQAYLVPPKGEITRAPQALKSFVKTFLEPDQMSQITLPISLRDLAFYDVGEGRWCVASGVHRVDIGFSSRDIKQSVNIEIAEPFFLEEGSF